MMAGAMPRAGWILAATLLASPAGAQDSEFFAPPKEGGLEIEGLVRHERTRKIFVSPTETRDEDRWRFRLLPRISAGGNRFKIQVGGDLNYSTDDNREVPPGGQLAIIRDNYDSRSARLDLATARLQPTNWLLLEGGRFVMPIGLTEMIWDRDLRPQGGTLKLTTGQMGDIQSLSAAFLYSQGAHVFDDGSARMMIGSASARLNAGTTTSLELTGSYIDFSELGDLELMIRRQNSRAENGLLAHDKYRVLDVVGRVQSTGNVPLQIVADMSWNTEVEEQNRGLWLALVLGSLKTSRARLEYTYARVERDATVAAYASDDFFWATGWEGHRVDIGTRSGPRFSVHAIGQLQRFKDAPRVEERDHWMQRFRVELRLTP